MGLNQIRKFQFGLQIAALFAGKKSLGHEEN
jgi:hypothetical protein